MLPDCLSVDMEMLSLFGPWGRGADMMIAGGVLMTEGEDFGFDTDLFTDRGQG